VSKSVRDVLEELRHFSLDERDKGARFEKLMKDFLKTDTQYERLFDEVWLWSEYPERGNRADTGIDLVARERDTGELIAIQCKFYAPRTLISKPDIDSFLASSSKAEFQGRMFISTSDNWGKNAEEAIAGQKPEVARIGLSDLDNSSIDWDQFSFQTPENLEKRPLKSPRPHQEEAIKAVLEGFETAERGKLIMACGTGKTFTSLKLVERMFPQGGTVLFLVPSISLLSQALKEWTIECQIPLRSYAVCSDVSVGKRKNDEDLPVTDLAFPATTNTERLVQKFSEAGPNHKGLTVIFSTYQSIDVVAQAQSRGIPEFDLIICDEAHRTTGVTLSDGDESAFVKVHNQDFIKGLKRLYMTATPKVFSDASTKKAEEAGAVLADMGKPDMFGEEFHRLGFGEAVERGILTDYKVLVLAVDETYVAKRFQRQFADEDNSLKLEDAAKIVGCWNGLSKRSIEQEEFQIDPGAMKRAVAFSRSIAESKKIAEMFQSVVDEETRQLNDDETEFLRCEVEHVDGTFNSLARNEKLDWLKQEVPENTARILSNARCLTEGVDVPALDAVMFLNPRDSQVDVVQAVGRVMRKLEGKKYGYVILPIGVPADMDPATALNDNSKYKVVWQVLQALRSHDERFDAMVNKIDLTKKAPQIGIIGVGGGADGDGKDDFGSFTLDFPNFDQWRDAILSKIVQKVGEKRYWESWAKDVAGIAQDHMTRISSLVDGSNDALKVEFARFLKGLQDNLNPSITKSDAIEMLSQHLITRPVFDALFEGYAFGARNPVSQVMQGMIDALEGQHLEKETEKLGRFYDSVRTRAAGITDASAKQQIVKELYEKFFQYAFSGTSDRLGIVYTPNEIVDFIIHSVDDALRSEFGASFSNEGVHVLDPFTGTGTFIVRLLQSGLIKPEDLLRKYRYELHANELVLLAYYVAAINIEETFHELAGGDYEPFQGIVLTDTFQMNEAEDELDGQGVFPENSERVEAQKSLPIQVVIGNPPWSAGQVSGNDTNRNLKYPTLDARISETYVAGSTALLKNKLYDSYIRAIRWASDRIGDRGIVSFVSNGGFIDSNVSDGLRKVLVQEFADLYVFNLRGNTRTAGEQARREGGQTFGSGSRATVAIYLFIRNSDSKKPGRIHYRDIGDYLTREQKLEIIRAAKTYKNVDWIPIRPNESGDWVKKRSERFAAFSPLTAKSDLVETPIFKLASLGLSSNRAAWVYGSSKSGLREKVLRTLRAISAESEAFRTNPSYELNRDSTQISWSDTLMRKAKTGPAPVFDEAGIVEASYRPFNRQYIYLGPGLIDRAGKQKSFFPPKGPGNLGFIVSGFGGSAPFSVLMVDAIPDLSFPGAGNPVQFFPRYTFEFREVDDSLFAQLEKGYEGFVPTDNVSDVFLERTRAKFGKDVSTDDIFYYVYGVLHSPDFREAFEADLKKMLPRIPMVKDFRGFSAAGRNLAQLHLGFETVEPYPVTVTMSPGASLRVEKMRYVRRGQESVKTDIVFNSGITVSGIPEEAHEYMLGSRSAIDWIVERYQVKTDKASGIVNDPNDWAEEHGNPRYILDLLARIVTVSVETVKIVKSLPPLDIIE
jgi:predicted helicase